MSMKFIETTHELIKLLLAPVLAVLLVFLLFINGNKAAHSINVELKNQGIQIYISGAVSSFNNKEYEIIDSDDKIVVVLYKSEDTPKVAIETEDTSDPDKPIEATVAVKKDF